MRIRRPANLSKIQLALGIAIGIISGVYIYQPFFVQQKKAEKLREAEKESTGGSS